VTVAALRGLTGSADSVRAVVPIDCVAIVAGFGGFDDSVATAVAIAIAIAVAISCAITITIPVAIAGAIAVAVAVAGPLAIAISVAGPITIAIAGRIGPGSRTRDVVGTASGRAEGESYTREQG
jgi:hypothetical protein